PRQSRGASRAFTGPARPRRSSVIPPDSGIRARAPLLQARARVTKRALLQKRGRPMDLNYSSEDRAFRDTTRRWLEANVPSEDLKTLAERKAWHRKLYEAGYVGMLWPKEYGGW